MDFKEWRKLAIIAMCIQEEAHTRPLISDMVKTINFLTKMQHTTETFLKDKECS